MRASVAEGQKPLVFKKAQTLQSTPEGSNTIDPDVGSLAKAISIILQSQIQEVALIAPYHLNISLGFDAGKSNTLEKPFLPLLWG